MTGWQKAYTLATLGAAGLVLAAAPRPGPAPAALVAAGVTLAAWFGGTRAGLFAAWGITAAAALAVEGWWAAGAADALARAGALLGAGSLVGLAAGAARAGRSGGTAPGATAVVELEAAVRGRTGELAEANAALREEARRRAEAEAVRTGLLRRLTTAQEDERSRIARELHDQMGQYLAALGVGLRLVGEAVAPGSPAAARLAQLRELTELAGREAHRLAIELRPAALDDVGLRAAVRQYAEDWACRAGVAVDFYPTGATARLPGPVETALYRLVQEALTNVLKHAAARRVSVVLHQAADQVHLTVEDDGRGFDPDAAPPPGRLGLLGMRERAAQVGGRVSVESSPGQGAVVVVRIPLTGEP
jgi:signal transduction histidine kinase